MSQLQDYLKTRKPGGKPLRWIVCADGFSISVQASHGCFCTPQRDKGPWTEVECGYPSSTDPMLDPYLDGADSAVYGHVPIAIVERLLASHGGWITPTDDGVHGHAKVRT